ncbi:hypothetical protein TWF730_008914 [Orbilia blumenaviensis]|uniref:Uncharacterized protein n=1 Tax=Orbilia blumenaviensis TaxID=1796055 RepID=A0AAV9UWZ9_9PEZI
MGFNLILPQLRNKIGIWKAPRWQRGIDLSEIDFKTLKEIAVIYQRYQRCENRLFITQVFDSKNRVEELVEIPGDEYSDFNHNDGLIRRFNNGRLSTALWPQAILEYIDTIVPAHISECFVPDVKECFHDELKAESNIIEDAVETADIFKEKSGSELMQLGADEYRL